MGRPNCSQSFHHYPIATNCIWGHRGQACWGLHLSAGWLRVARPGGEKGVPLLPGYQEAS